MIEHIIGERRRCCIVRATSDVAPGIIARRVGGSRWIGTRGSDGIESLQLMRMGTIAIQVLLCGSAAIEGSLPQLPQMGIKSLKESNQPKNF